MKLHRSAAAVLLAASSAFAQSSPQAETLLGAALRHRPHYDGSDRRTTDLVPVLRASRGPLFARTTYGVLEGGARFNVSGALSAGVQLAHEAGPRDGDPGASVGAHVEWTTKLGPAPVHLLGRLRNHLDSERGRQLDARATIGVYQSGGLRAGVFAQATWASEKHLASYYGVRESGLLYTSLGLLGSYDLGRHWLAVAGAELRRLAGEPARSAFVQDRTASTLTAGVAYRF